MKRMTSLFHIIGRCTNKRLKDMQKDELNAKSYYLQQTF